MSTALDQGVTLFDTADVYSNRRSEEVVGQWLASQNRDHIVLATKGGGRVGDLPNNIGASRVHLMTALEDSLRRLRTDRVDVYYVHFPDAETPREETLTTLDDMVRSGKVRYVALSNYPPWQIALNLAVADHRSLVRPIVVQASYSLVDRTPERDLVPLCLDQGLGIVAYWPLGGGVLTGKYKVGEQAPSGSRMLTQPIFEQSFTSERISFAEEFAKTARSAGFAPPALALGWVASRPAVSAVLVGATKEHQLCESLSAVDVEPDPDLLAQLECCTRAHLATEFRPGGATP